jgi:hypothetical protein
MGERFAKKIQEISKKNKADFILFLIPVVKRSEWKKVSLIDNIHLFEDFSCYYPGNLGIYDYQPEPDDHLSNKGHKKYADFIIRILITRGYPPKY